MKRLFPILESLDIKTAISIDDDNSEDCTFDYSSVLLEDFLSAYKDEFETDELRQIEDSGVITLQELIDNEFLEEGTKDKIIGLISESQNSKALALNFLKTNFSESTEINYISTSSLEKVVDVENDGIIWFLDKELGGRELLEDFFPLFKEQLKTKKRWIFVVFTRDNSFESLNASWDERVRYLNEIVGLPEDKAKSLAYSFHVIIKSKITEKLSYGENAAASYCEEIIIDSLCGFCFASIIQNMKEVAIDSYNSLLNISKNSNSKTIERLFFNISSEGESNIYREISEIQRCKQEKSYLASFDELRYYIRAGKKLSNLGNKENEVLKNSFQDIVDNFEWTQYQFIYKDVNRTYSDIGYGDVFNVSIVDHSGEVCPFIGVLITQACDCVVRDNKGQITRKAKNLSLLLFEEWELKRKDDKLVIKNSVQEKSIDDMCALRDKYILLDQKKEGGISCIKVDDKSGEIKIASFILDLTSLNHEGKAILLSGDELQLCIKSNKIQSWSKFETPKKEIVEFQRFLNIDEDWDVKLTVEKKKELIGHIYSVPYDLETHEFSIQRIGRLMQNSIDLIRYYYVKEAFRTGKNALLSLRYDVV